MIKLKQFSILTLLFAVPFVASVAKTPVMPQPLRGVWYADTPFGHKQCTAFRKAPLKRDYSLVTALLISKYDYKSYADYLEGDYMVPIRINRVGRNNWKIQNRLLLDVGEIGDYKKAMSLESSEFSISSSQFLLKNKRLHWSETTSTDSKTKHTYTIKMFKCL